MYLHAESIRVVSDESGFELEIIAQNTSEPVIINIHGIDLDAFYDQVRSRIGAYLRERDEARASRPVPSQGDLVDAIGRTKEAFRCDPDESAGMADEYAVAVREDGSLRMERDEDAYDPADPKHPAFHSTHADIWDARDGK